MRAFVYSDETKQILLDGINDRLTILQTGMERDDRPAYQIKDNTKEPSIEERVRRARARWEMWGWRNRPIEEDTNTLEGYLRSIPGIERISFGDLMETYGLAIIKKFYHPEKYNLKNEADAVDFVNKCYNRTIDKFVFVQLTKNPPRKQVIVDMFDDDVEEKQNTATATFIIYPSQEEKYSKAQ